MRVYERILKVKLTSLIGPQVEECKSGKIVYAEELNAHNANIEKRNLCSL